MGPSPQSSSLSRHCGRAAGAAGGPRVTSRLDWTRRTHRLTALTLRLLMTMVLMIWNARSVNMMVDNLGKFNYQV